MKLRRDCLASHVGGVGGASREILQFFICVNEVADIVEEALSHTTKESDRNSDNARGVREGAGSGRVDDGFGGMAAGLFEEFQLVPYGRRGGVSHGAAANDDCRRGLLF